MNKTKIPRIVTMMRVKNEARWLDKVFKSISGFCNEIIILDDGSTDSTLEICENSDVVVEIQREGNLPFDETRDKNNLLKSALKRNPDLILTLDGDEVFSHNAKKILLEEINILHPNAPLFAFQGLTIYDKPNQYRYDGVYSNSWARKLIRMSQQPKNLQFDGTEFPGNAHCSSIPQTSEGWEKPVRSKVKVLHYGYYDDVLRKQKYKFYTDLDPSNKIFDGYRHIISSNAKFSGKEGYEFRQIPEGLYLTDIE